MARSKRQFYSDSPDVLSHESEKARVLLQRQAERDEWNRNVAICREEAKTPWHDDYVHTCRQNIKLIMSGQLAPQDAATAILRRFPGLSPSALTAWAKVADRPIQDHSSHQNSNSSQNT